MLVDSQCAPCSVQVCSRIAELWVMCTTSAAPLERLKACRNNIAALMFLFLLPLRIPAALIFHFPFNVLVLTVLQRTGSVSRSVPWKILSSSNRMFHECGLHKRIFFKLSYDVHFFKYGNTHTGNLFVCAWEIILGFGRKKQPKGIHNFLGIRWWQKYFTNSRFLF